MFPRLKNKYYALVVLFFTTIFFIAMPFYSGYIPSNAVREIGILSLLIGVIFSLIFIPLGVAHRSSSLPGRMDSLAFMYYNLEPQSVGTDNSEHSVSKDDEPTESDQSGVESLRQAAEDAVESAEKDRERNDFSEAVDAYESALNKYQFALEKLPAGQPEIRTEVEEAIELTRQDLNEVTNIHENQRAIREALQPAERSLQEAIVAYIENDQTVARIRFRQARDTFEDAHETITESEDDLLTEPVVVDVQPDRNPTSTTLSELSVIPEAAATALADAGIETVANLDGKDESPWRPTVVEELVADDSIDEDVATTLTLLSWWHGDETYTFETAEAVERRQQQADYGFNQSS